MDKSDFMIAPPQHGNKMYTLTEALELMEPIYAQHKITIKKCISGLADYAAELASTGQTAVIPILRQYTLEMAEFWGLNDDLSKEGYDRPNRSTAVRLTKRWLGEKHRLITRR